MTRIALAALLAVLTPTPRSPPSRPSTSTCSFAAAGSSTVRATPGAGGPGAGGGGGGDVGRAGVRPGTVEHHRGTGHPGRRTRTLRRSVHLARAGRGGGPDVVPAQPARAAASHAAGRRRGDHRDRAPHGCARRGLAHQGEGGELLGAERAGDRADPAGPQRGGPSVGGPVPLPDQRHRRTHGPDPALGSRRRGGCAARGRPPTRRHARREAARPRDGRFDPHRRRARDRAPGRGRPGRGLRVPQRSVRGEEPGRDRGRAGRGPGGNGDRAAAGGRPRPGGRRTLPGVLDVGGRCGELRSATLGGDRLGRRHRVARRRSRPSAFLRHLSPQDPALRAYCRGPLAGVGDPRADLAAGPHHGPRRPGRDSRRLLGGPCRFRPR